MRKDPLKEAVRYLSARSRSEAEVKAYLARRGHDSESAGAAVEALRSERLLGDEAAAVRWADELAASGRMGRMMAFHKLIERGVPKDIAESAVDRAWSGVDEVAAAVRLLSKAHGRVREKDRNALAKAARFLGSKGFGSDVVAKAIRAAYDTDE